MNFSGISNNRLSGRLLRHLLEFIPTEMKMVILQGRLRGKKWIAGASNHGCWLGSYEFEKRMVFERLVKEEGIVFDIGAHVGFYTLLASDLVGANGKVFAFEPLPRNLHYLKEHLKLNSVSNVTIVDAAVSDSCGSARFTERASSSTGRIASKGELCVKTISLDELIEQGQLQIPDYVKIDVEGAEMLVLSGAESMLANAHPIVFLATHGTEIHRECCEFLRSLGYHLSAIGESEVDNTDEVVARAHNTNENSYRHRGNK